MDQTPAPPPAPKPNPLPVLFVAIGGAGCLGVLLLGAILAWIFWPSSKPKAAAAPATASTSTVLAAKETVVGEPGSAQVTVPAGAVDKDVSLALTPQSKEPRSSPGVRVVGQVWSLRVDGHSRYKFKKPVRIALPFERGLAKNGNAAALSWWDGRRWAEVAGSRVDGDRVVGDVDHFTDFGVTEKDPETALPPTWADIGSWYVDFDISTSGHWGTNYVVGSTDWTVSRRGSASFRLSNPFPGVNMGKWSIPANPSPEDKCNASVSVADGGYRTDNDHDRSGNVFYHSNWNGGGSSSHFSAELQIDVAAGTYRLFISTPKIGKVDYKEKSSPPGFGKDASESAEASFNFRSGPLPLPAAIGAISGNVADEESKINGGISGSGIESTPAPKGAIRTEVSWTISPGPPGLKAKIDGPRVVRRGEGITLDGSRSTGEIAEYLWTFDVESGGPECPNEKVELRTPTVNFTALWDFKATLEVKDKSGKKDTAVRHVKVTARKGYDWETRFQNTRPQKPDPLTSVLRAGSLDGPSMLHFGINLCAIDGPNVDYSGHYIHRKPSKPQDVDKPTWADVGYEAIRVGDDGPFGGLWFVLKSTLEIDRTERLNKSLFPKGEVYVLNDEKHNLQDVLNLQQQVRDHEYWHTQLAKEEFEKVRKEKADPAVKIEKIIKPAKQDLVKEADQEIRGIDARIATAADEGKVKDKLKAIPKYQRDCSIWLYKGDPENKISVKRPLGKLWSLGDDLQDAGN